MENHQKNLQDLLESFNASPEPTLKATNYFEIYSDLFGYLRGTNCTFIEVGVFNGGSLFMWRDWLGKDARIIGVDLNPAALKWKEYGFEIHIGDQGDPLFWQDLYEKTGRFDVLLDDGGHQTFQQIVTLNEGLKACKNRSLIVIEDTIASHMIDFKSHQDINFQDYSKTATEAVLARSANIWAGIFKPILNPSVVKNFNIVRSIEFFSGIIAFNINTQVEDPRAIWNRAPTSSERDFRGHGLTKSANVEWPDPFNKIIVEINGI